MADTGSFKEKQYAFAAHLRDPEGVAAPEGIERVAKAHADVDIYCCAIDAHLDENAYIVPGLGDAGDRFFNTQ